MSFRSFVIISIASLGNVYTLFVLLVLSISHSDLFFNKRVLANDNMILMIDK